MINNQFIDNSNKINKDKQENRFLQFCIFYLFLFQNNNMKRIGNGSNDLQLTDVDSDAGDGLKNVYTNQDHSPLKIYDKKLDWSHVKSHLMVNGTFTKKVINTLISNTFLRCFIFVFCVVN